MNIHFAEVERGAPAAFGHVGAVGEGHERALEGERRRVEVVRVDSVQDERAQFGAALDVTVDLRHEPVEHGQGHHHAGQFVPLAVDLIADVVQQARGDDDGAGIVFIARAGAHHVGYDARVDEQIVNEHAVGGHDAGVSLAVIVESHFTHGEVIRHVPVGARFEIGGEQVPHLRRFGVFFPQRLDAVDGLAFELFVDGRDGNLDAAIAELFGVALLAGHGAILPSIITS